METPQRWAFDQTWKDLFIHAPFTIESNFEHRKDGSYDWSALAGRGVDPSCSDPRKPSL